MKIRTLIIATVLIAGLILSFTETTVFAQSVIDGGVPAGADAARGESQPSNLFNGDESLFKKITNVLLYLIGAISVIMIIIGGLRYILSGGDSSNITAAKNTILYAIVGVVVAILAYAAVNFIIGAFVEGGGGVSGGSGGGSATSF